MSLRNWIPRPYRAGSHFQVESLLLRRMDVPNPKECAWPHAVLARIAFDARDMDWGNTHYGNALRADRSASGWALLQPVVAWLEAEDLLGL